MNEATLLHVLRHHRHLPAFALAQQRCEWISLPRLRAQERKVGVMGLGSIGLAAARELARHGFQVAGWVNSPRQVDGIEVFAGRGQFPAFLQRSEIVVNFLPPIAIDPTDTRENHEKIALQIRDVIVAEQLKHRVGPAPSDAYREAPDY